MNTFKQLFNRDSTPPLEGVADIARTFESTTNMGGVGAFDESIDSDLESRLNALANVANQNSNQPVENESCQTHRPVSDLNRFLADESLTQLAVRSSIKDSETIVQYSRCPFEPGQTRYVLHVQFYPALANAPTIDTNVIDFEARVRVTDCQQFGARIEIISSEELAQPKTVVVETTIHSPKKA